MNSGLKRNKDDGRATMLAISDASNINEFTISSSLTETHPLSIDHNQRLINEIIDSTFNDQKGLCEVSSSHWSSLKFQSSQYSYDKRLKYWKTVLREREKMSVRIVNKTKKDQSNILYNRLVTVDERDKFTVKRLMDFAQRLNPSILIAKQPLMLKEKCDTQMSAFTPEIQETLPLPERCGSVQVEIVGLPKVAQEEMLGKPDTHGCRKPYSWLKSKHLENIIEKTRDDLERVLEYYPDTEHLQIVGQNLLDPKLNEDNSDIHIFACRDICKISTDTLLEGEVETNANNALEIVDYAFKVNDQEFIFDKDCSYSKFKTLTNFLCFPFQTEVKKVFTIQNIGRKVLTFEWKHSSFYFKNSTLAKCRDNEFVFDNMAFRLCGGEVHEIFVMFQPRRVGIVKSKWILKVTPALCKRRSDGIAMFLSGLCAVPLEYEQKLLETKRQVIDKSNKIMIRKLTSNLSTLATDLQPCENTCPYERCLSETELFEQLNVGFKCERYNDLELLKEIYQRAKKPRDKMWDLQVNTIKSSILNVPQAETRALLFNELHGILNTMKSSSVDLETKLFDNTEINHSRFLYVRGIINTAVDEWVNLISTIEETFYQTTLTNGELALQNREPEKKERGKNLFPLTQNESQKRQYVLEKKVRRLKSYRDILYMQTYTFVSDLMENIVNVIESIV